MEKIFITRPIPKIGLDALRGFARTHKTQIVSRATDSPISRAELLRGVRGASAIISMLTEKIDAKLLRAAGLQLKIVANFAVGLDNIDTAACAKAGVIITNTPEVLTQAVAEHTFAVLMATAKRVVETDGYLRAKKYKGWGPFLWLGSELKEKTLGIIGTGRIGSEVARIAAQGFKMKILYTDKQRNPALEKTAVAQFVDQKTLLTKSDFVSVHVPLLPATHHLIGATQLKQMKSTAFLINTSRGPVIDEKALVIALRKKIIAGAGLDVYEFEPNLAPGLTKLSNVVLTPHTASATVEARNEMARICAENIIAVLSGKPAITPIKL